MRRVRLRQVAKHLTNQRILRELSGLASPILKSNSEKVYKFVFSIECMNKRGSLEMSMSTIITIVLSIVFLILALILIKNMACKAQGGVNQIDDAMREQIKILFVGADDKIAVKDKENNIQKEVSYGVAFLVRNLDAPSNNFSYIVEAVDLGKCTFDKATAENFIILGKKSSSLTIPLDSDYAGLIKFKIPSATTNCELKYQIKVKNDNTDYATGEFTVNIKPKSFAANIC
jgi:hypothetical protein